MRVFDRKVDKFHLKVPVSLKRKMDNGTLSLESMEIKNTDRKMYMVVFRSAMRRPLFTGQVVIGHSKMRRVEDKAAKNQLKILLKYKHQVSEKEPAKVYGVHCTCNFTKHEDLIEFETQFAKALDQKSEEAK